MRKFSFIFGKLVADDNDVIGLLAYSIYKKQKIEFIEQFIQEKGHDPSEEELDQFHQFTIANSQIEQYKTTAESNLNAFVNNLMSAKSEEVEGFYKAAFKAVAKETGHGYWYGVFQGVVSSIIYTLLLGLLIVFFWSTQAGPKEVIERVFKVKITSDTTSIQPR